MRSHARLFQLASLAAAAIWATACGDLTEVAHVPDLPRTAPAGDVPNHPDDADATAPDIGDDGAVPLGAFTLGAIEPSEVDVTGGDDVMLSGTGLRDGLEVVFGDSPALDVFVVNHTTAIVVAPPHPAGVVDVSAWHPEIDDAEPRVLPRAFRYRADLVVSAVDPPEGAVSGGEALTVTGTGFTADTRLFIGGRLAIRQTWLGDGALAGIAPAGAAGPADVQVAGTNGVASLADGYRYREAPAIATVSPIAGSPGGGETARLQGRGLDADAVVRFAGRDARVTAAAPDGHWLDVIAPPGPAGETADITVTSSWGADVADGAWTWRDPQADPFALRCASFYPRAGAEAGGEAVALACRGLQYGAEVTFGQAGAEVLELDADGTSWVLAPPGQGQVLVTVTTPFAATTLAAPYTYLAPPTLQVTGVAPASGEPAGGDAITVTGAGFSQQAALYVGPLPASDVVVVDQRTITATTPPGAPGAADVVVRQSAGAATLVDGFDFSAARTSLDLVAPHEVAQAGGTYLRLYGSGFPEDAEVRVGGEPCPLIRRVSSAELHVRSPKLAVGTYDAAVASAAGDVVLPDALTVYDPRSGYGGTWGAAIDETLNVTVRGTNGYGPIPGAFVIVGDAPDTPLKGYTDDNGQLTFSEPGFSGPVDVTATKEGFSSYTVVRFDAKNLTLFLNQDPTPTPPSQGSGSGGDTEPPPNATLRGRVLGMDKYVVAPPGSCQAVAIDQTEHCAPCDPSLGCLDGAFSCVDVADQGTYCAATCESDADCPQAYACGATTDGARCLPSPGDKIAYCNVAAGSIFGYEHPIQETAWVRPGQTYELDSRRLGDLAIYCFGGYRDDAGVFTPTVLGVRRHVFAASGVVDDTVDVQLEHQLKRTFRLRLADPPTWPTGLQPPNIVISLDLGADGVIPFSRTYLDAGDHTWLAPRQLAALSGNLHDTSYFFYTTVQADVTGAYPRAYNLVQHVERVVEDRLPVRDGGAWTLEGKQIQRDLYAVYAATGQQAYAVGEDGLLMLFDGVNWTQQSSQTEEDLHAIDGRGGQDIWAVGDRGAVRHWDGVAWHPVDAPLDNYRAVAAATDGEVVVAGDVRVRSYRDAGWRVEGPPSLQDIHGLAAADDGRVLAVGSHGRVFHRAVGGAWSQVPTPRDLDTTLFAAHFDADDALVVVGAGGAVLVGDTFGLRAVDLGTTADLTALAPTADGGLVVVGDFGTVADRGPDGAWVVDEIPDYRSKAHGVFAPADGGPIRVVGSAAFILGPLLHFPIITAPLHEGSLGDTTLSWTWFGGPEGQFSRLRVYPEAGASIWDLIVEGAERQAILPDITSAAGFDALGSGRRRLEVTRVLNERFDIDSYSTRDLSIYRRDSWSTNQSTFYAP